jgi:transcriptional regulator with XRE-family HTH domain
MTALRRNKAGNESLGGAAEAVASGSAARAIRRRLDLTLEQVAERVGISSGHLSRYERGDKSLSIAALMRLARALNTSVSALLGEKGDEDLLHVVRAGERRTQRTAGAEGDYAFVPLSRSEGRATANAFIVQLDRRATIGKEVFHEGHEMFFVLSGSVEIALGSRVMRLCKGDFAEFPGLVRHQLRGLESNTSILVVVTAES